MAKDGEKGERKRVDRPFPRMSLEKALRVPTAIKEKNAGNPWPPEEVAKALGVGPKTGNFYYLTAASRDYGLTEGSSRTEKISLSHLGRRVLYPNSPEEEAVAKREAFLSVDVFQKVLEYYKGSDLPEKQYLSNTLQTEFGLNPEVHDEFIDLYQQNCQYLGIGHKFDTSYLVPASPDPGQTAAVTVAQPEGGTGQSCFVIMPFVERSADHPPGFFEEVLRSLIAPAAENAGFTVTTANRQGSDVIQSTIVNDLLQADLVVADLTEHNPNVLFELGMRMCEDRPVALIKSTGTGRIFDVDNMLRVYEYDSCLWPSTVADDLPKLATHIQSAWDNRDTGISYMKLLRQAPLATYDQNRNF
ncbi:hypothetical protein [Arhodomonas aquaeolei]|uniref:hypothetical protein n=1 Tax=Arhodomonas aquaeolei TaxID=2369 RepID=UPI001B7F9D62|nr:hypothetical protein [Arhodomonas aquaeolei]